MQLLIALLLLMFWKERKCPPSAAKARAEGRAWCDRCDHSHCGSRPALRITSYSGVRAGQEAGPSPA